MKPAYPSPGSHLQSTQPATNHPEPPAVQSAPGQSSPTLKQQPRPASSPGDTPVQKRVITPVSQPQDEPPPQISPAAMALVSPLLKERAQRNQQLEQQTLGCIYNEEPVNSRELLTHMLLRNVDLSQRPDLIALNDEDLAAVLSTGDKRLLRRAANLLPNSLLIRQMANPDMARALIPCAPRLFGHMPQALKTTAGLKPLLDQMDPHEKDILLLYMETESPALTQALTTPKKRVRGHPESIATLPDDQITPQLRQLAVSREPSLLSLFRGAVSDEEYETLCNKALRRSGEALRYIDEKDRTLAHVLLALEHPQPPHPLTIPPALRTRERLELALDRSSPQAHIYGEKISRAFLDQWNLWDTLKKKENWLAFLPREERTESLCQEYIIRFPHGLEYVPRAVLDKHPEWWSLQWDSAACASLLMHDYIAHPQLRDHAFLSELANSHSQCLRFLPTTQAGAMPTWTKMMTSQKRQMSLLNQEEKRRILCNGGTEGLADATGAPPCRLDPDALLDAAQEDHISHRAALLPGEVRKKLAFCDHFQLPREQQGQQLRDQMDQHSLTTAHKITSSTVPVWTPTDNANWQIRGGRTLVRQDKGRCLHMKFQRKDEPLATFAAEEAVQRFAQEHKTELGLRSEIPQPEGIVFVPQEDLPEEAHHFADPLQIRDDQGRPGFLAFCFSTENNSYDTPIWQASNAEDKARAKEGLMRTFHDLGVWSSLGAMHTSTIALYHHVFNEDNIHPELLLTALFQPEESYPGKLHLWNSAATEASDWGWSGLRDLGDLEFYPDITCYIESVDAKWTAPGSGQRASFVNAIAQNILGGLLLYMRQERSEPDYHYQNREQVAALALCIEEGCNTLLDGLLRDGTRLETLFPDEATYKEWLTLTAREMVYWSAEQNRDEPCFSRHLEEDGRPTAELYPDHPYQSLRYKSHFTDAAGESLGPYYRKLPLFSLVRGLYVMAAGLADRLTPPGQPDQESKARTQ